MKKFLFVIVSLLSFSWALAQVNINTATAQELQTLNGIGPAKAAAIVEYRTANGPFKSPEDIKNVVVSVMAFIRRFLRKLPLVMARLPVLRLLALLLNSNNRNQLLPNRLLRLLNQLLPQLNRLPANLPPPVRLPTNQLLLTPNKYEMLIHRLPLPAVFLYYEIGRAHV